MPPHRTMDADQARSWLAARKPQDHTLLDVRQDWEYAEAHLPGARHIPLGELAERAGELDPGRPTVVYCRTGGRSAAAAALLAGRGFTQVFNLAGGITAWSGAAAAGPPDAGLRALPEDGDPAQIVLRAWGMEAALGDFYTAMAGQTRGEVAATLTRLAGFEERHKARLLKTYRRMTGREPEPGEPGAGGSPGEATPLEGGLSAAEFIALHGPDFTDPRAVVETGMMFEAQAMDLYARCAARAATPEARDLLATLAREEQAHLKALGSVLDRLGRD